MKFITRKGDVAFWIVVAFLLGIFAASDRWNIAVVFSISIIAVTIMSVTSLHEMLGRHALIIFFAITFGVIYYFGYVHWISSRTHLPTGKNTTFFALVTDEPQPAGNFILLKLQLSHSYSGAIDIFTSPNSQFQYGDLLWVKGNITSSKDADEPPAVFLPQLRLITSNNGFWLKKYSVAAKLFIIQKFSHFFSSDKAALLGAIVTGNTGTLSATLKAQMNDSGTSYIVGMYGYKIALISLVLFSLLKDFLPRTRLVFLTFAMIALFIFFSGGSVSVIRAGIMGSLALLATALGRKFVARNALTFTAVIMALLDPRILIEAAFQLSFLSYLGIYHLGPPLRNFFHWDSDGFLEWKQHAMLSLSTNLAIIPVVMGTFGGFSLTSFISNVLIMIPWAVIIFLGLVIVAIGSFLPSLMFFPVAIINLLLGYELFIIRIFAGFVVPIPSIFTSTLAIIFYYGLLLLFIYYYGEA